MTNVPDILSERVIAETRAWVERAVIGLQLCPFARAPQTRGLVRYAVSQAALPSQLRKDLDSELLKLAGSPSSSLETTLLIHPRVLTEFSAYNDFLEEADDALVALDLVGTIQVASFHPQYQFAGSEPGDLTNATNQSPYPLLHLLREESVERAVATIPDTATIFETNMSTMKRLGRTGWVALRRACVQDAIEALERASLDTVPDAAADRVHASRD